ncbi:symmetrical bis(5'-nucleosyl)-tetraphosphatase [Alteromonas sp. ASW11-19]|uniref:bis(5'-nucleosyl)-tetraphosphatase (symmetrical) n=1 Tax=Alteromonas salexigens TaxID=2982530 RepID=A0ABT2VIW0_9ALTE|nr:symmetrical bis(5'-nucleosyl)-tetraphosphatase [Alteromonas salexigens]MCU7553107.1 symmetrical bis(5'-nucleosyl)-tetraphosphatase [Alteromonas salexigens]
MAQAKTFVIGDIQGCFGGLTALLDEVGFDARRDTLCAVGDLVARGEDSLATVELLMSLGDRFHAVLGNHDLHLLAVTQGIRKVKASDKLENLLNSPRLPDIIEWLRQFPLAKRIDPQHTMVHAGLYPAWSTDTLLALSDEISNKLLGPDWVSVLQNMYGDSPRLWKSSLSGDARARFIINACTRMRFLNEDNALEFTAKGSPLDAPANLHPWFTPPNPQLADNERVLFGHWAALNGRTQHPQFIGLDTGYVWGQSMTAYEVNSQQLISVPAR